ncbi:MAG: hypothetical protein M3112_06330 [Actinomycetia bacterium]|nr:hypothetical protein [Actinomycetes bacterium]
MRLGVAITVAAVALTACVDVEGAGPDANIASESPGNAAVFCRVWPDAREKILALLNGETTITYQEQDLALARFMTDVDTLVPREVRPEWNQAYATVEAARNLLFVTGYAEGTIRPVHLTMAFGAAGPEAAVAKTETAIAFIDDWSIDECGDFASRWGELEQILQIHDDSYWRELGRNIDRYEAALVVGTRLVPAEISSYWDTALRYQSGYFELARSFDFNPHEMPPGEEGEAVFEQFVGLTRDEADEALQYAKEMISVWVEANSDPASIAQGASGGPGSVHIQVLPHPYLTNRMLLMALLPPGADFAMARSAGDYVAGTCTEIADFGEWSGEQERLEEQERLREQERLKSEEARRTREERMDLEMEQEAEEARRALEEGIEQGGEDARQALEEEEEERQRAREEELFNMQQEHEQQREEEAREAEGEEEQRQGFEQGWTEDFDRALQPIASFPGTDAEYADQQVCNSMHHETEPALVPGGGYELFVGAYDGDPGSYGIYFAAPEYCIQIPVTVDGDTVVDLPELEPCELVPLGRPEEIARRAPSTVADGGTLQVRINSALAPQEWDWCRLDGVALPAGTSLNNVALGKVWPSGMFTFSGADPNFIEDETQRQRSNSPGLIPFLSVPPSSGRSTGIGPNNSLDRAWDADLPDPIPLPDGAYDLRFEETCENENPQSEEEMQRRCAFLAVEVDGATIVEMPELEACP